MSDVDHLMMFADLAAREVVFPTPDGAPPCWFDSGRTVTPGRVVLQEPTEVAPAIYGPGAWVSVRTSGPDAELEAMAECLLVTEPDRAAAGEPFIRLCRLSEAALSRRYEPLLAGDLYTFGPHIAGDLQRWMIA